MTAEQQALEYGSVTEVSEQLAGDELAADVAAGALELQLYDAVDFDEDGGTLALDDGAETVAYTSADLDTDQITLAAPLAAAYLEGVPVRPSPDVVERRALVQLDVDGEAIDARVPHTLFDRLELGTRSGVYERVSLYLDGSEWVVEDLLGREPVVDGSYIDPATLPAAGTDGEPPAASPTTTITSLYSTLLAKWPGLENADTVGYDVYLSAPDRAAAQVATTYGTAVLIGAEADGTPLRSGVTYSVWVHAFDADGHAPAAGNPGTGALAGLSREQLQQQVQDELTQASADAAQAQADAAAATTTANNANTEALAASGLAESKGKVLYSTTAPTGEDAATQNLWIDTSGSPAKNQPNRWTGSAWTPITDKAATDAATAAANAQTTANQAQTDATNAATTAGQAQTTANGKNTVWYLGTPPAGTGHKTDDLWFDTANDNRPNRWSGTAWVQQPLGNAAIGNLDAAKITTGYLDVANRIEAGSLSTDALDAEVIVANESYAQSGYIGILGADQISTGILDAAITLSGQIKTAEQGQRVVLDGQGLHLFSSAGTPLVDMPTDPTKVVSIKNVDAEVQNLAVKGGLSIETKGTVGAGAGLELVGGVLAPSTSPGVTLDHEVGGTNYVIAAPGTASGTTGNLYVYAAAFDASYAYLYSDVVGIQQITKHPIAGGAQVASVDVSNETWNVAGLAIDSASGLLWVFAQDQTGYGRTLRPYSTALVAQTTPGVRSVTGYNVSGYTNKGLGIYNGVAYVGLQKASTSYQLVVPAVTLSTGAVTSYTGPNPGPGPGSATWPGFSAGPFDYGDGIVRMTVATASGLVRNHSVSTGTSVTERTAEQWELGNDGNVGSFDLFAWTGSEFRQLKQTNQFTWAAASTTVSVPWKRFTGIRGSGQWWASYTWRDSDAAGAAGTSETDQGKRASFTMKPRYRLRLASGTIPDYGGTDDPNAVSFYVGQGATDPGRTGMWRQAAPANGVTTADLTTVSFSGTNPPAANDFPGSTPGYVQSGSKRSDGTPKIKLDGLGAANVDGLIPPGSVMMWAGPTAPTGWELCDGRELSRSLYPDLAGALYDSSTGSYRFGNGNGSTTFNLPDMRMRLPIGADPATVFGLGQSDGRTDLLARSDSHSHSHGHNHSLGTGTSGSAHSHTLAITAVNLSQTKATNTTTGGGATRVTDVSGDTMGNHSHAGSSANSSTDSTHTHNVTGSVSNGIGLSNTQTSAHSWQAFHFIIKL